MLEGLPPPTTEGWAHRRQEVQLEGPGLALVFEQQSLFGALSTAGAISPMLDVKVILTPPCVFH